MALTDPYTFSINHARKTLGLEEEPRFNPANVDWEELADLYGDDPALAIIFSQMHDWFQRAGWWPGSGTISGTLKWTDASGSTSVPGGGVATGSGTSTAGLYLYGDPLWTTATPMKISDNPTVSWDTSGTMNLTYDEE